MAQFFEPGTVLKSIHGNDILIEKLLAQIGRGAIYQVTVNGEDKAFKWCTSSPSDNDFYSFWIRTKEKVERGIPCKSIIWPEDITDLSNDGFGYVMQLIPEGYHDFYDFISKKVRFSSFRSIIDTAINLVNTFQIMHCSGYCYYAHNGDFWVNPNTGKLIIANPEYVVPDGIHLNVLGHPRYMSPEVVLGIGTGGVANDRYVMGVYLFMLFCLSHPLEGRRFLVPALTPEQQKKLYGSQPLFMMDPNDISNGPHPLIHKDVITIWNDFPKYMRQLFLAAFSKDAILNPSTRLKERDWLKSLIRFRSEVIRCSCGNELFYEAGQTCQCNNCHQVVDFPLQLKFGEYCIPANKGTTIFRCQFGACDPFYMLDPIAYIVEKKDSPGVLGIRNMTDQVWDASTTKGMARNVSPREVVPLKSGITINLLGTQLIISEENPLIQSE